jgi:hypothetical protein
VLTSFSTSTAKKHTSSVVPVERIERAILLIRGHKVMLDRDLAELYGVVFPLQIGGTRGILFLWERRDAVIRLVATSKNSNKSLQTIDLPA